MTDLMIVAITSSVTVLVFSNAWIWIKQRRATKEIDQAARLWMQKRDSRTAKTCKQLPTPKVFNFSPIVEVLKAAGVTKAVVVEYMDQFHHPSVEIHVPKQPSIELIWAIDKLRSAGAIVVWWKLPWWKCWFKKFQLRTVPIAPPHHVNCRSVVVPRVSDDR